MTAARISRLIEVYLYGALLGVLITVAVLRFLLLFLEMRTPALAGTLIFGASSPELASPSAAI